MNSNEISIFEKVATTFRLNDNQRRVAMNACTDISRKRDVKPEEIMASAGLRAKNADHLLAILSEMHQPDYHSQKQMFEQCEKSLALPPKAHIVPPPYFETKTMKLEIFFKNTTELEAKIDKIKTSLKEKTSKWKKLEDVL